MLGVDHDKIILLSTPFPTIPMLGKNCCYNVIVFFVGKKRCYIVLYCIVLYKLHKKELNVTNASKYLGVTTSKDLHWTPHIHNITGKAKNTLRFVEKYIKTGNKKVKEIAYNTYVRTQLEYCSTIWSPWQKTRLAYSLLFCNIIHT